MAVSGEVAIMMNDNSKAGKGDDAKMTTVARSLTPVGEEGVKRRISRGLNGKRKTKNANGSLDI